MDPKEVTRPLNEVMFASKKVSCSMEDFPITLIETLDLDLPTIKMQLGVIAYHSQVFNSLVGDLQNQTRWRERYSGHADQVRPS